MTHASRCPTRGAFAEGMKTRGNYGRRARGARATRRSAGQSPCGPSCHPIHAAPSCGQRGSAHRTLDTRLPEKAEWTDCTVPRSAPIPTGRPRTARATRVRAIGGGGQAARHRGTASRDSARHEPSRVAGDSAARTAAHHRQPGSQIAPSRSRNKHRVLDEPQRDFGSVALPARNRRPSSHQHASPARRHGSAVIITLRKASARPSPMP